MQIMVGVTKIEIRLSNNTYAFDSDSATGKTFLYKLLRAYEELNDSVITLSYPLDSDAVDKIRNAENKIIVVDRYDLYQNLELSKSLFKAGEKNIVLIDIKEWNKLPICPCMTELELREGEILLYD